MSLDIRFCNPFCLDSLKACTDRRPIYKAGPRTHTSAVQTGPATGISGSLRASTLLPNHLHLLDEPKSPLALFASPWYHAKLRLRVSSCLTNFRRARRFQAKTRLELRKLCILRAFGSKLLLQLERRPWRSNYTCTCPVVASSGSAVRQAFCYSCLLALSSQQFEGFGIVKLIEEVEE